MPILKDFRQTKKITIERYEGSEVEIYDSLLAGDLVGDEELKDFAVLVKYIKSWNFTDEEQKDLPINVENLKLFDSESLTKLAKEIETFSLYKKKE